MVAFLLLVRLELYQLTLFPCSYTSKNGSTKVIKRFEWFIIPSLTSPVFRSVTWVNFEVNPVLAAISSRISGRSTRGSLEVHCLAQASQAWRIFQFVEAGQDQVFLTAR
jgi:hypothetical protein